MPLKKYNSYSLIGSKLLLRCVLVLSEQFVTPFDFTVEMEGPELMQSIGVIIKQNSFETIHDKIPIALILDLITIF